MSTVLWPFSFFSCYFLFSSLRCSMHEFQCAWFCFFFLCFVMHFMLCACKHIYVNKCLAVWLPFHLFSVRLNDTSYGSPIAILQHFSQHIKHNLYTISFHSVRFFFLTFIESGTENGEHRFASNALNMKNDSRNFLHIRLFVITFCDWNFYALLQIHQILHPM